MKNLTISIMLAFLFVFQANAQENYYFSHSSVKNPDDIALQGVTYGYVGNAGLDVLKDTSLTVAISRVGDSNNFSFGYYLLDDAGGILSKETFDTLNAFKDKTMLDLDKGSHVAFWMEMDGIEMGTLTNDNYAYFGTMNARNVYQLTFRTTEGNYLLQLYNPTASTKSPTGQPLPGLFVTLGVIAVGMFACRKKKKV